jgi:hypothetical protein
MSSDPVAGVACAALDYQSSLLPTVSEQLLIAADGAGFCMDEHTTRLT